MPVEAPAGVAREQFEQIHTTRNRFRNQFPFATFAPGRRVEQSFERAGHRPYAAQFDCLRNIGDPIQGSGDSSIHEEEIDGGEAGLECPLGGASSGSGGRGERA